MKMQVFFKNLYGQTITLEIDEHAKVSELLRQAKERTRFDLIHIQGYENTPAMEVYLNSARYNFVGMSLASYPDTKTLSDIGLLREATFYQINPMSKNFSMSANLLRYETLMYSEEKITKEQFTEISKFILNAKPICSIPKLLESLERLERWLNAREQELISVDGISLEDIAAKNAFRKMTNGSMKVLVATEMSRKIHGSDKTYTFSVKFDKSSVGYHLLKVQMQDDTVLSFSIDGSNFTYKESEKSWIDALIGAANQSTYSPEFACKYELFKEGDNYYYALTCIYGIPSEGTGKVLPPQAGPKFKVVEPSIVVSAKSTENALAPDASSMPTTVEEPNQEKINAQEEQVQSIATETSSSEPKETKDNKQALIDLVDRLTKNIEGKLEGRKTSGINHPKVGRLKEVRKRLSEHGSLTTGPEQDNFLHSIRLICEIKRHSIIHFWKTPHSVKEFEQLRTENKILFQCEYKDLDFRV